MTTTQENVRLWSVTTGTANATTDGLIASSDSQSPDTVDNNIRSIMTSVKRQADDQGGWIVAGGTATALTATTASGITTAMLVNGLRLCVRTASASTGAATIAVDAATVTNIKRADGAAIAAGDWVSGAILELVYSSTATAFIAENIGNVAINGLTTDSTPDLAADYVATYDASATGHKKVLLSKMSGMHLLTSGSASGATLDIVLTSYTAYRGIKIFLSSLRPATDAVALWCRFSTDGGSSYDATGYDWGYMYLGSDDPAGSIPATTSTNVGSSTLIYLSSTNIGNGAAEGYNGEITLLNQTATAAWSRITHQGYYISSAATPKGGLIYGGGAKETAQDTDAIRFLFSSGNITSGNYAVYGLV